MVGVEFLLEFFGVLELGGVLDVVLEFLDLVVGFVLGEVYLGFGADLEVVVGYLVVVDLLGDLVVLGVSCCVVVLVDV